MPKGAIAEPVEKATPRERLKTLSAALVRDLLWKLWDHRWLLAALTVVPALLARYVLGPVLPLSGLNRYLVLVLGVVLAAAFTEPGREIVRLGRRRRARRLIWGDWLDFCEDAECTIGPAANRRAPYLLSRPTIRGRTVSVDVQRIHGTSEEKVEHLARQLARYFRVEDYVVEPRPGRIIDASRVRLRFPAWRRRIEDAQPEDEWAFLDA